MVTKELHFFDGLANSGPSTDVARQYARYFPRPPGRVAGEWTPRYMFDLWTPALLHRCAPDAKLLVLLRDPVERYRSHLARARQRAEQRGRPLSPALTNEALARGRYFEQLVRLFRHFDRDQVLILQYERCCDDPETELKRTYGFLGLEPVDHMPAGLRETTGIATIKGTLDPLFRQELLEILTEDTRRLIELVPELDLARWPSFDR